MNKKSFFLGILTGVVLTFICLFVIALVNQHSNGTIQIEYFEKPMSYENKQETSFKVLQVLGNAALAKERSDMYTDSYYGKTVVILGKDFYSDQVVKINKPQRVGTYNYTNNGGMPMTVPVIQGSIGK